jgi:hypothetical protein
MTVMGKVPLKNNPSMIKLILNSSPNIKWKHRLSEHQKLIQTTNQVPFYYTLIYFEALSESGEIFETSVVYETASSANTVVFNTGHSGSEDELDSTPKPSVQTVVTGTIQQVVDASVKSALERSNKSIQAMFAEFKKEIMEEIKRPPVSPSVAKKPGSPPTEADNLRRYVFEHLKDMPPEKLTEIVAIMKK